MSNEIGKLRISHIVCNRIFIVFKLFYKSFVRDGPFDFSWGEGGGGAQIRILKKISSMSRIEEKKIEHQHHQKKYRAQKISKLAILYIERKMIQPDFWF